MYVSCINERFIEAKLDNLSIFWPNRNMNALLNGSVESLEKLQRNMRALNDLRLRKKEKSQTLTGVGPTSCVHSVSYLIRVQGPTCCYIMDSWLWRILWSTVKSLNATGLVSYLTASVVRLRGIQHLELFTPRYVFMDAAVSLWIPTTADNQITLFLCPRQSFYTHSPLVPNYILFH